MLDSDSAPRAASAHTTGPGIIAREASPHALQILTTEHWSLLASRQLGYTEAMSRASIFIAALSGAVVALALVAQAADFGDGFVAFALVLLPVVFFLGIATIARLSQVNREEAVWVQGLNRLRHAYLELAPELEPYFVTSRYDDDAGVLRSSIATPRVQTPLQGFIAIPGVVAVLDSVVAGATVGIAALALELGTGVAIAAGAVTVAAALAVSLAFFRRIIAAHRRDMIVRFPTPAGGEESPTDRRSA